jgi:hypothetical protein
MGPDSMVYPGATDPVTGIASEVATPARNTTTISARYSPFATQAGPSRTDAPSFPASSPRTLTSVAAQASYSPSGMTGSNPGKSSANQAVVGPATPTTSAEPGKRTADTSLPAEKQWDPGQTEVLPFFADRKPRKSTAAPASSESSGHAKPDPLATNASNDTTNTSSLGDAVLGMSSEIFKDDFSFLAANRRNYSPFQSKSKKPADKVAKPES